MHVGVVVAIFIAADAAPASAVRKVQWLEVSCALGRGAGSGGRLAGRRPLPETVAP